jgi:ribonuclease HI
VQTGSKTTMFQVYADGSFDAGSGTGSWAFVAFEGDRTIHTATGSARGTSNNSIEVMAIVRAMTWIESETGGQACALWTDSVHVIEGCRRWRAIWRTNGWTGINPNPRSRRRVISDFALWQQLDALLNRNPQVSIEWCKGHSGVPGNDLADALARGFPSI